MANRLDLYNDALLLCKERFLSSLDENVKARRLLDQVWSSGEGTIRSCLEQGQWPFAMRTARIDYDPDVTTQFGYANAFDKPTDWVLTSAVCSDERFNVPLRQYADETEYWLADITPIYVKYVSDDDDFGGNLGRWPESFADYVSAYLASKVCHAMGCNAETVKFITGVPGGPRDGYVWQSLLIAKNRAMMTQPQQRVGPGSWSRARAGRRGGGPLGDGGNPGALTG